LHLPDAIPDPLRSRQAVVSQAGQEEDWPEEMRTEAREAKRAEVAKREHGLSWVAAGGNGAELE